MLVLSVVCGLCALTPSQSHAATAKSSKKGKSSKGSGKAKSKATAPSSGTSSSSKSSPSKVHALVNAGLSPSPLFGFGGTLGMIKDDGGGLEASLTLASGKASTISASVTHIGARYRIGLAKIGYIAAGAGFRMASGKWFVLNTDESAEYEAGSSLNAVTLDAAAGTQFRFGKILLGADLFGISFPLFKLGVKKTVPSEEDYSADDASAQQGKFDKIAAGMNLTLVKVGVGMMF